MGGTDGGACEDEGVQLVIIPAKNAAVTIAVIIIIVFIELFFIITLILNT